MDGLPYLLHPMNVAEFLSCHSDRTPLFIKRRSKKYYDVVLPVEALDRVLAQGDLRYPDARIVRDGVEVSPRFYTCPPSLNGHGQPDYIDTDSLFNEFGGGGSIVLDFIHRKIETLRALCESCSVQLGSAVQANVYITPPGNRALNPHYDTHSTFILQIHGRKRWTLYSSNFKHPLPRQTFSCSDEPLAVDEVFDLNAGDLLYLPRGVVHSAHTVGRSPSVHVTLGAQVLTRQEVLEFLVSLCDRSSHFRQGIPELSGSRDELLTLLSDAAKYLGETDFATEVCGEFSLRTDLYQVPDNGKRFLSSLRSFSLSHRSILSPRGSPKIVYGAHDQSYIVKGKLRIRLSPELTERMSKALALSSFKVSDLFQAPAEMEFLRQLTQLGVFACD